MINFRILSLNWNLFKRLVKPYLQVSRFDPNVSGGFRIVSASSEKKFPGLRYLVLRPDHRILSRNRSLIIFDHYLSDHDRKAETKISTQENRFFVNIILYLVDECCPI